MVSKVLWNNTFPKLLCQSGVVPTPELSLWQGMHSTFLLFPQVLWDVFLQQVGDAILRGFFRFRGNRKGSRLEVLLRGEVLSPANRISKLSKP